LRFDAMLELERIVHKAPIWTLSEPRDIIDRGWPCVFLNSCFDGSDATLAHQMSVIFFGGPSASVLFFVL